MQSCSFPELRAVRAASRCCCADCMPVPVLPELAAVPDDPLPVLPPAVTPDPLVPLVVEPVLPDEAEGDMLDPLLEVSDVPVPELAVPEPLRPAEPLVPELLRVLPPDEFAVPRLDEADEPEEPVVPEPLVELPSVLPVALELFDPLPAEPVAELPDDPAPLIEVSSMLRRERQSALADVVTAASASRAVVQVSSFMTIFLRVACASAGRLEPPAVTSTNRAASTELQSANAQSESHRRGFRPPPGYTYDPVAGSIDGSKS
jgi:hypothetical protein